MKEIAIGDWVKLTSGKAFVGHVARVVGRHGPWYEIKLLVPTMTRFAKRGSRYRKEYNLEPFDLPDEVIAELMLEELAR
jgi:hypothetical protein